MPTVLVIGPYRLFFVSQDCVEPPHVHVQREKWVAKFWLAPVQLARPSGFSASELNRIARIVQENETLLLERWHEHCGG